MKITVQEIICAVEITIKDLEPEQVEEIRLDVLELQGNHSHQN